ncbi:MAG TPA: ECF-type sigma factor [Rhodanobacteraceae bacterium]|nr:ECF-type sigma factor [Rhodanobacteraceae bacterium]
MTDSRGTAEDADDARIHAELERLQAGDREALDRLLPLVLDDLRRLARAQRRRLGSGETLRTTALIHEAYLKLRRHEGGGASTRRHFLHTAALAMRQILIDHARSRMAARARHERAAELAEPPEALYRQAQDVLDIDIALRDLEPLNPRLVEVVNCRYFAGYSERETGELLGVSERTVRRDWLKARAWLANTLRHGGHAAAG